ncbi:glycosyltransferase [Bizionia sediminis]|uniref:Glycosyltransferase n=1 Tax=Bizionia sediminis TaxID=1737064 RepID=A0ABW5KPR9_9FLAO
MKPAYTIVLYTPQELNHASNIQTGLFELEKLKVLNTKIVLSITGRRGRLVVGDDEVIRTHQANPKVSFYELIIHASGARISFACDLYDHANQFSEYAFNHCDFVFKRSYETKYVNKLPKAFQSKLYKLGLCFGVRSKFKTQSMSTFYKGLILSNLKLNIKPDRLLFKRLVHTYKAQLKHWNFILTARNLERFEDYTKPSNATVFFQTRCFTNENDIDVLQIHQQRYHIIKLLRQAFPYQFQGGFIKSPIAMEKYYDAISDVPAEPELYLNALKQAKIVIYTRGLANSTAWKMAEYLSQGKVIIAEKLTTDLPVPLVHGQELLYFETDEELLAAITLVLEDDVLADMLSKKARAYFETHVHPVKNVKRILELMLSKPLF